DIGHRRVWGQGKLRQRRGNPGEEIKEQKLYVAEPILDIVAKDPQKQHVAEEMQPATMHEHGSENGDDGCGQGRSETRRDKCPTFNKLIAAGKLEQENRYV